MKKKLLTFNLFILFFILLFNACTKIEKEQVNPAFSTTNLDKSASARVGGSINGALPPSPPPCQAVSTNTINQTYRNTAVSLYGSNGGINYDRFTSYLAGKNPDALLYSYNGTVYNYCNQIKNAILTGSNVYGTEFSSGANYSVRIHSSYINSRLTPIKNTIINDTSLTANQKNSLLQVFDAISKNFDSISYLVSSNLDCFPDPIGLSATSAKTPFKDGAVANSWVGKALKKIVNVTATIFVAVVVNTALGAIAGVDAALFPDGGVAGVFLTPVGFAVGAGLGYLAGMVTGIKDAVQGKYVCVFSGVGNCN